MAKTIVIIEGDYNDGDYVKAINKISPLQQLEMVKVAAKLKKADRYSYAESWREKYGGALDEKELDFLESYMPSAPDADTVHSIESIRILEVTSDKKLY
jgi:hypothetical protein